MAAQTRAIPLPLRAEGRGRSSLLAYGSKSSATTPLCTVPIHFPRGSRSRSPRDDLEITLPRFPAFIPALNNHRQAAQTAAGKRRCNAISNNSSDIARGFDVGLFHDLVRVASSALATTAHEQFRRREYRPATIRRQQQRLHDLTSAKVDFVFPVEVALLP